MKDIEYILNDALNKAICQSTRIKNPNSNKIADFVSKYLENEKLTLSGVVKPFYCLNNSVYGKDKKCLKQCLSCKKNIPQQ